MTETFTVRELCTALSAAVSSAFPDEVWVQGSISSLTRAANGHVYFDLVDPADDLGSATPGLLPVTLFSSDRQRVNAILRKAGNIRMSDGVEIRIRGRVAYYPPQGRVQLRMSLIDPAYTVGQMAAARQALLDALAVEGLLNAQRGLALPVPPLRVALLTSAGSAAHADFAHELAQSGYPFEITLYDCRVQGIDAVPSIVEAITLAATRPADGSGHGTQDGAGGAPSVPPPDVIVLVRGGGARTDLAAFDHERVARAIATCPLPVLVGVGHEIDRSVADEVAHLSAKTPTATAALLVDAVRAFHQEVEQAAARLAGLASARLEASAGRPGGRRRPAGGGGQRPGVGPRLAPRPPPDPAPLPGRTVLRAGRRPPRPGRHSPAGQRSGRHPGPGLVDHPHRGRRPASATPPPCRPVPCSSPPSPPAASPAR